MLIATRPSEKPQSAEQARLQAIARDHARAKAVLDMHGIFHIWLCGLNKDFEGRERQVVIEAATRLRSLLRF